MIPPLYNRIQDTLKDRTDHPERLAADKLNIYTTVSIYSLEYFDYVENIGKLHQNYAPCKFNGISRLCGFTWWLC